MSTDEYVPSDEDFIDSWACAHVTPHDMTAEEAKDAARAFLARVRRDAAREALGELAEHSDSRDGDGVKGRLGGIIRIWRDGRYPEETP